MYLGVTKKCRICAKHYDEPFAYVSILHLRLKLQEDKICLHDLIKRHMYEDEKNPCVSTECVTNKEVLMEKQVNILEAPEYLFVCADRNDTTKIETKIMSTDTLSLPLQNGEYILYKLFAVVEHIGQSTLCGHYVTYVDDGLNRYKFDDHGGGEPSFLSIETGEFMRAKENGYLFFFKRFEVSNSWRSRNKVVQDPPSLEKLKKSLLNSSEVKKREIKGHHCFFCEADLERSFFLDHLKKSQNCKILYLRKFRCNDIEEVRMLSYDCIGCDMKNIKLKKHFQKSRQCFEMYLSHFKMTNEDMETLLKKIKNVKRKGYDSKSKKNLNEYYKKYSEAKRKSITKTEAMNTYRRSITFSNYYKCCICKGNYLNSRVTEFTEFEANYRGIDLRSKEHLSRMNTLSICNDCKSGTIIAGDSMEDSLEKCPIEKIHLDYRDYDNNKRVYFPSFTINPGILDIADAEAIPNDREISILLPISLSCVSLTEQSNLQSDKALVQRLSMCSPLFFDDLCRSYTNQFKKYQNASKYASRYFGVITDSDDQIISNIEALPDDKKIHSSSQWTRNNKRDIQFRFQQSGQKAVNITIKVPKNNIETYATVRLINGDNITFDYLGNSNGEVKTDYFIHSHGTRIKCSQNCPKTNLRTLFQNDQNQNSDRYSSVFTASVFIRLRAFVELVKNPNFRLHCENYSFSTYFSDSGDGFIHGCIWPLENDEFNKTLHEESYGKPYDKLVHSSYEQFVVENFSTFSDKDSIQNQFHLGDQEAEDLSKIVKEHQVDLSCDEPYLPSLETFDKIVIMEEYFDNDRPINGENITQANRLLLEIQRMMKDLDDDSKWRNSVKDWLINIGTRVGVEWDGFFQYVKLTIETRLFMFASDKLLIEKLKQYSQENSSFLGFYQYCRIVTDKNENDVFITRTDKIIQSFTSMYNPFILKVVDSPIKVFPIHGSFQWDLFPINRTHLHNLDIDQRIIQSHKEVSLNEMTFLLDTSKCRIFCNPPTTYLNTKSNSKQLYKKVMEETEDTFAAADNSGYFEPVFDDVSRHLIRRNGIELLLAETGAYYDVLPMEDGLKILECFEDMNEITKSLILSPINGNFLPEYIFCSNGQVMKIRKSRKILSYPICKTGSDEWKFMRVLLFYPLEPNAELQLGSHKIQMMMEEKSSANDELSIIDYNEKVFLGYNLKSNL